MRSPLDTCISALSWAEQRDYAGFGKGDALNSPILRKIAGRNRFLRSSFVFLLSRSPINLRPILAIEAQQNPKALALFARTYLNIQALTDGDAWTPKAVSLLGSLLELSGVSSYSGHCWGAEHPRGDPSLGAEAYFPGTVVTCEVGEAFLDAFQRTHDEEYLEVAKSATEFIRRDLTVIERDDSGLCLSYVPSHSWKVINSNAKSAALMARTGSITLDESLLEDARANMKWVIGKQTRSCAWFYADPPEASHVSHDNYHTGFILSSLYEYLQSNEDRDVLNAYKTGLEFYENHLFMPDGAPKWRYNRAYPLDIKGAAQGILNFSLASELFPEKLEVAERIAIWMIENMWTPEGRFFYQKGRFLTKKYTLMRWCQSWSCFALSVLAGAQRCAKNAADRVSESRGDR